MLKKKKKRLKKIVSYSMKEKYFLLSERKQGGGKQSVAWGRFLFMELKFGMLLANMVSII